MAASCEQFERGPTVGVDSSDGRAVSYGRSGLEFIDAAADVEQIEYINPFRRATPPRQRTDCEGGGRRVHGLCGQRVPPSTRILRSYTSTTVGRSRSRKFKSIDRSSQTTDSCRQARAITQRHVEHRRFADCIHEVGAPGEVHLTAISKPDTDPNP